VLEMGLGASSIALGVFGIIRVRSVHKLQLGDASPIWSGMCVSQIIYICNIITSIVNRREGITSYFYPVSHLWTMWDGVCKEEVRIDCKLILIRRI
jgi:hypothetical protein